MFGLFERIFKSPVTTIAGIVISTVAYVADQGNAFTWHSFFDAAPAILGLLSKDK